MSDYKDGAYYLHYYSDGSTNGPFDTAADLCEALGLMEYPSRGYIATWDAENEVWGSVPSLNPDDLYQPPTALDPPWGNGTPDSIAAVLAWVVEVVDEVDDLDDLISEAENAILSVSAGG